MEIAFLILAGLFGVTVVGLSVGSFYFIRSLIDSFNRTSLGVAEQFQIERYKMREHEKELLRTVLDKVQQPAPPLQFERQEKREQEEFNQPITLESDSVLQDIITRADFQE